LGEAYQREGRRAPDDAPAVRVTLSGEAGGEWDIQAAGDELLVTRREPSPRPTPPSAGRGVWIRQTAEDFLVAFRGDEDLPALFPDNFGPLDLLFLDPRDVELVRQIDGRLALELDGRRRRRWRLDLAAGKSGFVAGRARSTVRVDAATYDGLRAGTVAPLKALLDRRIVVDGDRGLAMQALLLLGARLNRT
jgi:SCP-2 sterol transfer family protein